MECEVDNDVLSELPSASDIHVKIVSAYMFAVITGSSPGGGVVRALFLYAEFILINILEFSSNSSNARKLS
jgi:hypothetical protein